MKNRIFESPLVIKNASFTCCHLFKHSNIVSHVLIGGCLSQLSGICWEISVQKIFMMISLFGSHGRVDFRIIICGKGIPERGCICHSSHCHLTRSKAREGESF